MLLYKRLENGKFQWPRNQEEVRQITTQEFKWLLEEISNNQPKAVKKINVNLVV